MCLPIIRQCPLPSLVSAPKPVSSEKSLAVETPVKPQEEAVQNLVDCDEYDIPILKRLCSDPGEKYKEVCEVAFSRTTAVRADYPSNDDTEKLDLSSDQGVRDFLNSYVQVDQERAQDPEIRDRAEAQCTTSCTIAAYLISDKQSGLATLTAITQSKLVGLARQRGGIPKDIRPLLQNSRPFLDDLQKKITDNKVTRGDIERFQEILSTLMNEGERTEGAGSLHEKHDLLFGTVNTFFEGTDFHKMLAKEGLEIMGTHHHAVLKIKGKEVFDPFPAKDGQQLTANPMHVSRYNHSQQMEISLHGQDSSSIK